MGDRDVPRLNASPLALVRMAAGGPRVLAEKGLRLGRALTRLGRLAASSDPDPRLVRLLELGVIEAIPTRLQLLVGSIDMLRFWISPAAAEYYASRGIHFGFHQLLRVLEEPASMIDPTGLATERDVIVDHLLQVVHANPAYDLELLSSHERGLEELEAQIEAVMQGAHPKAACLAATVEDAGYHARLLAFARAFRADPAAGAPIRENVAASPHWRRVERTFGTLRSATRYFCRLPLTPLAGLRHVLTVKTFPFELGEAPQAPEA